MVKVIATDMDGTFLDAKGSYSKERLNQLMNDFKEQDYLFTVSSGRALLAVDRLFQEYLEDIAVIAENGCIVQYKGEVIYEATLTEAEYLELIDIIRNNPYSRGTEFLLSGKNASYILEGTNPTYIEKMNHYYENVTLVPHFNGIEDDIFKITANFEPAAVINGTKWLNEHLDFVTAVTTGFESIDIIPSAINKATGLARLVEKLGLTTDDIIAFGDNHNDREMLEMAGVAIATANAQEDILELVDEVIGHHDDGAVMDYLEEMVKG